MVDVFKLIRNSSTEVSKIYRVVEEKTTIDEENSRE